MSNAAFNDAGDEGSLATVSSSSPGFGDPRTVWWIVVATGLFIYAWGGTGGFFLGKGVRAFAFFTGLGIFKRGVERSTG